MQDILAAAIASQPCPPLPLQVSRPVAGMEHKTVGYGNSHHVIMQGLAFSMQRLDAAQNKRRCDKQLTLTKDFLRDFRRSGGVSAAGGGCALTPEQLYDRCTEFTRGILLALMPWREKQGDVDARFARFDEIAREKYDSNPIVKATCEHLAGMLLYDGGDHSASFDEIVRTLKPLNYGQLLTEYARVHRERGRAGVEMVDI